MKLVALWLVRIAGVLCLAHIMLMLLNPKMLSPLVLIIDLVMVSAFIAKEKENYEERKKIK